MRGQAKKNCKQNPFKVTRQENMQKMYSFTWKTDRRTILNKIHKRRIIITNAYMYCTCFCQFQVYLGRPVYMYMCILKSENQKARKKYS